MSAEMIFKVQFIIEKQITISIIPATYLAFKY